MKSTKDIAALLDEPACEHNKKEKSGCAFNDEDSSWDLYTPLKAKLLFFDINQEWGRQLALTIANRIWEVVQTAVPWKIQSTPGLIFSMEGNAMEGMTHG